MQRDALCVCACVCKCVCERASCWLPHSYSHVYMYTHRSTSPSYPAVCVPPAQASPFIPGLTNSISASAPSVHSQHSVNMAAFYRWISVGHAFIYFCAVSLYIVVLIGSEQDDGFDVFGVFSWHLRRSNPLNRCVQSVEVRMLQVAISSVFTLTGEHMTARMWTVLCKFTLYNLISSAFGSHRLNSFILSFSSQTYFPKKNMMPQICYSVQLKDELICFWRSKVKVIVTSWLQILVNAASQKHTEVISSNLVQKTTVTQKLTDYVWVAKGQRSRSLWPYTTHFWP